jgi:hypothetical protein
MIGTSYEVTARRKHGNEQMKSIERQNIADDKSLKLKIVVLKRKVNVPLKPVVFR